MLSSTVDLRLGKLTTLSLSGGIGNLDGAMLSSLGTIQAKGMVAGYAQIRLSSGPLFVQAYMNSINSGTPISTVEILFKNIPKIFRARPVYARDWV